MIKSSITEIFGIEYPIFQGGMAWVSEANLAAAVSRAGGIGIIAAMSSNAEQLTEQIVKCRELCEGKPFGVNIMLMSPFVDEVAQVVIEQKVPVVTTGAGSPAKYMEAWINAGIKVCPVVPSASIAKKVERLGATAIVAEGCESGGHIGELTTMALVPQVVDAVNIPVLAAGGIADGRGIAAALMLGAQGVQCGTRFLTASECVIHQNYKDKVIKAKDVDTMAAGRRLGHPVRAIRNRFVRDFVAMEYDSSKTIEEIEQYGAGALRKASVEGDEKGGSFMAGQIAGLVNDEATSEQIIKKMFSEAEAILNGVSKWVK